MKLKDFIEYILNQDILDEYLEANNINKDAETLLVYLEDNHSIDSEVLIKSAEDSDRLTIIYDNKKHVHLSSIDDAKEYIEDAGLVSKGLNNEQIAIELIRYVLYDA